MVPIPDSVSAKRAAAHVCRWGVVIVCLVLVPGAAFVGRGVGRWLRARTENRWNSPFDHEALLPDPPLTHELAGMPVTAAEPQVPISPDDSAAMYAGGRLSKSASASETGTTEVIPASHTEIVRPHEAFDRFTELEQVLKEQGALSYALESDRRHNFSYRFVCTIPSERPGAPERTIEASGNTPLEAIQRVVRQLTIPYSVR